MPYGYDRNYRGSSGYRPSSNYKKRNSRKRNRALRNTKGVTSRSSAPKTIGNGSRRSNFRRIRNRAIIIAAGLLIVVLVVTMVSKMFSCVCSVATKNSKTTTSATTSKTEKAEKKSPDVKTVSKFKTPDVKDDNSSKPVKDGDYYVWNQKAFEPFSGNETAAKKYGKLMNSASDALGNDVTVYSMIVPTHIEMGLPERLKKTISGYVSQADFIKNASEAMNDEVGFINTYNKLAEHCNDYIYFGGDRYWTGLGAHYAYQAFCEQTKQDAVSLDAFSPNEVEGYRGQLSMETKKKIATDKVQFWSRPSISVKNTVTQKNGKKFSQATMYDWSIEDPGDDLYDIFIFGDNPLEVIKRRDSAAPGGKIAVVHDRFGNAFVPYLTSNYSEVHSIDYRYFTNSKYNLGDFKDYLKKNNIKKVLFLNDSIGAADSGTIKKLKGLLKIS